METCMNTAVLKQWGQVNTSFTLLFTLDLSINAFAHWIRPFLRNGTQNSKRIELGGRPAVEGGVCVGGIFSSEVNLWIEISFAPSL